MRSVQLTRSLDVRRITFEASCLVWNMNGIYVIRNKWYGCVLAKEVDVEFSGYSSTGTAVAVTANR